MPFEPVQPARLAAPRDRRALATVAGSKRAALDRHATGAIGRADSVALHVDARRIRSETPPARAPSRFGAASARAA
ncbi:hypothetical protein [Burkholderia pseudomallei]|uniref:hypothetical protein n=1 Tax=Burkholderia pseudomallei TaxID=28450 RepID=UPI000DCF67D1|nr:hypothetical protein [Burkholderia pseudomallei]